MRVKKEREWFSIETALIYQREVTRFYLKNPVVFQGLEEYQALANFACHPIYRRGLPMHSVLLEKFGKLYSANPDKVIEFLVLARGIINKWETTKTGKVIKFLCERILVAVEEREIIYDSEGQLEAIFTHKLKDKRRKVSFKDKSQEEINRLSVPHLAHVGALSDKEVSKLLEDSEISPDTVKKARQELAKIYRQDKFLRNPAIIEFYKTGIKTKEYETTVAEYWKGKK